MRCGASHATRCWIIITQHQEPPKVVKTDILRHLELVSGGFVVETHVKDARRPPAASGEVGEAAGASQKWVATTGTSTSCLGISAFCFLMNKTAEMDNSIKGNYIYDKLKNHS